MNDESTALTIITDTPISIEKVWSRYGNELALAGVAADHASRTDALAEYHAEQTDNTRAAQRDALKCFSTYLAQAGIQRPAEDLHQDAEAWRGMSAGLLKGFRTWLLEQGFAIGTLNHRLSIIRQCCRLANTAGTIPAEVLELVLTVKGYGGKTGRNLAHGGEIRVESQMGRGSCFTVTLPLTPLTHESDTRTERWASLLLCCDALAMGFSPTRHAERQARCPGET